MPKKNKLRILENAQLELESIAQIHLDLVGASSARKITNKIHTALERLCAYPRTGKKIEEQNLDQLGYRMLICGKHLCFYRHIEQMIYVYHIVDGRTDYPKLFMGLARSQPIEKE